MALLQYNLCPRLDQPFGVKITHYSSFEYSRMGDQRCLYLDRRNPLPADLEHIIGASAVPVVALFVLVILIAGMNPVTVDHIFGLLMLVPVVRGGAVPLDQQVADFTLRYGLAFFIGDDGLIARHELTGTARLYLANAIADEDMQDFGAADAIQDIDVKFFLPAAQDIGGQGFSGGDADAYRGEIEVFLGIRQRQHTRVKRRHAIEDGRTKLLNDLEHILGHRPPRIEYSAGPDCKWEVQVVAKAVGEEELGR